MTKALRKAVRGIKGKKTPLCGVPAALLPDPLLPGDAEPATRRRGEDLETAILDATLDLIAEHGLGTLTMEGVAARAHTGKASVYRRWPSKEDLLVDAMARALPPLGDAPDTGSVRNDLLELLRAMTAAVNSRSGCVIQSFMFDNSVERSLVETVKQRAMLPRQQMFIDALARGRDRGEVRAEAVSARTAEVGSALIVHQYLMHGPPIPDDFVVQLVDEVLLPLVRP